MNRVGGLDAARIRFTRGDRVIVDGVDITVPSGSVGALLGPNGAGKSTLLHLIAGVERTDAGALALGGDDLLMIVKRVDALGKFLDTDDGANLLTGTKRAINILRIEEKKDGRSYDQAPDPDLLKRPEEKALAKALDEVEKAAATAVAREDFEAAMAAMARLRAPVDAFFESVTVNTQEAAAAVPRIVDKLAMMGVNVPIIGDFHYNGHQLLTAEPACAEVLAKYRINPGNVGFGKKKDTQFATLIELAIRHGKPVRIGANWGSLDQALAAQLMDENHKLAEPKEAAEVLRLNPNFSLAVHKQRMPIKDPAILERHIVALRKAGLK